MISCCLVSFYDRERDEMDWNEKVFFVDVVYAYLPYSIECVIFWRTCIYRSRTRTVQYKRSEKKVFKIDNNLIY